MRLEVEERLGGRRGEVHRLRSGLRVVGPDASLGDVRAIARRDARSVLRVLVLRRGLVARGAPGAGLAFGQDRLVREMALPRTKRALAGWDKACRLPERDPCPWELWILMADWLLSQTPRSRRPDVYFQPAIAGFVQFDLDLRPSEVLNLPTRAVVEPAGHARPCYHSWRVTVHPWVDETSNASKTAQMDDKVLAGRGAASLAVACRSKSDKLLPSVGLGAYERLFREASAAVTNGVISVHGGASKDAFLKVMSFAQLQSHGRWRSDRSVIRYGKHGRLLKVLNQITGEQQKRARVRDLVGGWADWPRFCVRAKSTSRRRNTYSASSEAVPGADLQVC